MGEPPRKKLLSRWRSDCGEAEGSTKNGGDSSEPKQYIVRIKQTVKKESASSSNPPVAATGSQVSHVADQTAVARERSLADNVKTRIRVKVGDAPVAETGEAPSMVASSTKEDEFDGKIGLEKYLVGLSSNWQVRGKRTGRSVESPVQSEQISETETAETAETGETETETESESETETETETESETESEEEADGDDEIEKLSDGIEDCHLDSADVTSAAEIIMDMHYHYSATKPSDQVSDSNDAAEENVAPVAAPKLNQQDHQDKGETDEKAK